MPKGVCDAVIADGFSGNIALKLIEGTAITLFKMIKGILYKSLPNKLAALVLKRDLYTLKNTMDSSEIGGALLLGVNKPVIKAHGSSNAYAFCSAIGQCVKMIDGHVVDIIKEGVAKLAPEEKTQE